MWKKISSSSSFWTPSQEGDSLEGYYQSRTPNQGSRQNSTVHTFKTKDGERNVWGSATLDKYLSSIPFGTKVKVVYGGKTTTQKGTALKLWEVYIDAEDTDTDTQEGYGDPTDIHEDFDTFEVDEN